MKKLIVGLMAIGLVMAACSKQEQVPVENDDELEIQTMSDKDIYFKPEMKLPDDPVVNDMVDIANSYAILRAVYCDAELWFRFGRVINDEISQVRTDVIKDKETRNSAEQYVKTMVSVLPRDTALWDQNDSILWSRVGDAVDAFSEHLIKRFGLKNYGTITDEDVEEYFDINQFIPNYDSIYDLRREQNETNERFLLKMAEQTENFDAKCIYTTEYAHQGRYDEAHPALPLLEDLMKCGKFSRYLHHVWRTWRVLRQIDISPSRDGIIANRKYNHMRFRCLNTILKEIIKNPKDIKAINDFTYLASYDNIIRYSDFLFGNSAPLEHMMLFPEIIEEDESSEEATAGE